MKKYRIIILLLGVTIALSGCSKFLDVRQSTETVNPVAVSDFEEMLNSDSLSIGNYFLLDLMSDDIGLSDFVSNGTLDNRFTRTYLWKTDIWNPGDNDNMYSGAYTRILQLNIILSRINNALLDSSNTDARRNNVLSQALIHRSWYYLQLANAYGKAYSSTAATDLAIPLVLTPDPAAQPARATVQQVYSQVIGDLHTAVRNPYLPAKGVDIIHPGKAAGFALLARTHLYMANYDSARIYADSSLALANTILNWVTPFYIKPTQLQDMRNNPEILMGKISYERDFYPIFNNSTAMGRTIAPLFAYNDVRSTSRYSRGAYIATQLNGTTALVFDGSLGVAEVMLIRAECLARAGNYDGAMAIVNNLASNRMSNYTPITNYDASNTLTYVLNERRRELFLHGGLRLFDLKRLNLQPATAVNLTRLRDDGTTVLAQLPASSNRYLVPFTPVVLANNPNMVQNPRQ